MNNPMFPTKDLTDDGNLQVHVPSRNKFWMVILAVLSSAGLVSVIDVSLAFFSTVFLFFRFTTLSATGAACRYPAICRNAIIMLHIKTAHSEHSYRCTSMIPGYNSTHSSIRDNYH